MGRTEEVELVVSQIGWAEDGSWEPRERVVGKGSVGGLPVRDLVGSQDQWLGSIAGSAAEEQVAEAEEDEPAEDAVAWAGYCR